MEGNRNLGSKCAKLRSSMVRMLEVDHLMWLCRLFDRESSESFADAECMNLGRPLKEHFAMSMQQIKIRGRGGGRGGRGDLGVGGLNFGALQALSIVLPEFFGKAVM